MSTESIIFKAPKDFNFGSCLEFIDRGFDDCLIQLEGEKIITGIRIENEPTLIVIEFFNHSFHIEIELSKIIPGIGNKIVRYISEWFDLERDLRPFEQLCDQDEILNPLKTKYHGLRLIGIPDLFEAICWAIIGQQVNLTFAYSLKRKLVETYGHSSTFGNRKILFFPTPSTISSLTIPALKDLKLSGTKAKSIIGIAEKMVKGELDKEILMQAPNVSQIQKQLTELYGIGEWSAHYVMMKCLKITSAFPMGDAGLQNAIKKNLNLKQKPSKEMMIGLSRRWDQWQAYATIYLWRSLVQL